MKVSYVHHFANFACSGFFIVSIFKSENILFFLIKAEAEMDTNCCQFTQFWGMVIVYLWEIRSTWVHFIWRLDHANFARRRASCPTIWSVLLVIVWYSRARNLFPNEVNAYSHKASNLDVFQCSFLGIIPPHQSFTICGYVLHGKWHTCTYLRSWCCGLHTYHGRPTKILIWGLSYLSTIADSQMVRNLSLLNLAGYDSITQLFV